MAAGEFPIAAELQVHTVERAKAQGAPVEWSVLDGVIPISKVAAGDHQHRREYLHLGVVLRFSAVAAGHGNDPREPAHSDAPRCDRALFETVQAFAVRAAVMDDFDKYVALFRETFKPAQ